MVNSFYDAEVEQGCAFEELISFHGGLGGPQTQPFILHPVGLPMPPQPVVGAAAVHDVLLGLAPALQNEDRPGRVGDSPEQPQTPAASDGPGGVRALTGAGGCSASSSFLVSSSDSEVRITVPPYCWSAAIALSGVTWSMTMNRAEVPGLRYSRTCSWNALSIPFWPKWPNSAPIPAPSASPANGMKNNSPNRKPQNPPHHAPPPAEAPPCEV